MARKIFRSLFCILSIVSAILFIAPNIYGDTPRNGLALVPAGNAASSASSQDFNDSAPNTFSQTSVQKQAQIQEINQLENSAGSDNSQGIQLHHQSLDQVLNHIPNTGNGNLAQQQHSEIDQLVNEIAKTPDQNIPATEAQINQYQFNFGPGVQIGGEYSSEFGPILNTKWGYQFRNNMAGVVEGDIGPKEYRLGLTWAYMLTAHQEMKITLEHLAQKMKFDFATGDIKKWINQNAIGADYEYLFSNKRFFDQVTLNSLGISGYYSKVGSQSFKTKVFQQDDYWYLDYRRIAGGTSKELQLNVGFLPWRWGSVKLGAGYSAVDYDMKYEKDKKSSGLGGSVDLEQLLSEQLKFDLSANKKEAYDDYKGGVSYLMHTKPGSRLELGVKAEHIQGHLSLPNDNRFGVDVNYDWGGNTEAGFARYDLVQENQNYTDQLLNWTMTPAVHMAKVLALKDEKVLRILKPSSSPIPSVWANVGENFLYDVSGHFQLNDDLGIFQYSLESLIASTLHAVEKIALGITNTGIITSDGVVSSHAVDTQVTITADKMTEGQKVGTTQQSFTIYVKPTALRTYKSIYNPPENLPICMENNLNNYYPDFNKHGGSGLIYATPTWVGEGCPTSEDIAIFPDTAPFGADCTPATWPNAHAASGGPGYRIYVVSDHSGPCFITFNATKHTPIGDEHLQYVLELFILSRGK